MNFVNTPKSALVSLAMLIFPTIVINAQSPVSGFYPKKNEITVAVGHTYKSNDKFYRGTDLTDGNPANFGEVSSSIYSIYGEYGINNWLSTTASLPYITTQNEENIPDPIQGSSEVDGIQDLSVFVKARAFEKKFKHSSLALGGATGVNVPVGNYDGRGILSLGSNATTIDGLAIAQYTALDHFFAEAQFGYSQRENSDYEVPNAILYSFKVGYFHKFFYVHTQLGIQNSLTGFDIGSQEFADAGGPAALPQTEVDYTKLNVALYVPILEHLGLSAGYDTTLEGRNVNKETAFNFGMIFKYY
ncbi:transporter [Aquimarina rhabdastrellae]